MKWGLIIIEILLAAGLTAGLFHFYWIAVRSLMKKPLNLPPSGLSWAKIEKAEHSREYVDTYEEQMSGAVYNNGIPVVQNYSFPKIHSGSVVSYEYDGKQYNANVRREGLDSGTLYCKKSAPEVVREYIPKPPKPVSTAISYLVVGCPLILFDIALFTMIFG